MSQKVLVERLNPVIRGWANYHRHIAAKDTFRRVDHEIWQRLWQWARCRHPKKSRDWVKRRYFPGSAKRAWDFAFQTGEQTSEGKPVWCRLVYASDTKIRRHVKIRQTANPFDPQWRAYFKERAFFKKFGISCQQVGIKPS